MKVLFVYQYLSSFVKKDLDILKSEHDVREVVFRGKFAPLKILKNIFWCNMVVCWFGKLNAFFAIVFGKILGKKIIIIAGDDDVSNIKINGKSYGFYAFPIKRLFARYIFSNTDLILPVSNFSYLETLRNTGVDKSKIKMIYHGFNGNVFKKNENVSKGATVVMIAKINEENLLLKRLDVFVESAKLCPDIKFILIGQNKDKETYNRLFSKAPQNIEWIGPKYGQDLVDILGSAFVYVQPSEIEGFGCAVAEAMLCKCIPVVSNRGALPEVVGNTGLYLDEITGIELARKIKLAFTRPELGKVARVRISNKFRLSKRRKELLKTIKSVVEVCD